MQKQARKEPTNSLKTTASGASSGYAGALSRTKPALNVSNPTRRSFGTKRPTRTSHGSEDALHDERDGWNQWTTIRSRTKGEPQKSRGKGQIKMKKKKSTDAGEIDVAQIGWLGSYFRRLRDPARPEGKGGDRWTARDTKYGSLESRPRSTVAMRCFSDTQAWGLQFGMSPRAPNIWERMLDVA